MTDVSAPQEAPAAEPTAEQEPAEPEQQRPRKDEQDESSAHAAINLVLNEFHNLVSAEGATFGVSAMSSTVPAPVTGHLASAIVSTSIEFYAEPEPYASAREALVEDGAVALIGLAGIGKRTGAIVLLQDVLPEGAPIVSLSPVMTLEHLAKKDYGKGQGYVIFDRFGAEHRREADHLWEVIRARLREAGAYLVVTMRKEDGHQPESVRHITWERPDLAGALRIQLGATATDEAIDEVCELMSAEYTMDDLVKVAQKITDGTPPLDAVAAVLDQSELRAVQEWFGAEPTREQILDITTLAFITGIGEREFELRRAKLEARLKKATPLPRPTAPQPTIPIAVGQVIPAVKPAESTERKAPIPQDRGRLRDHELIRLDRLVWDGVPRRVMIFREDGYRQYVLEELIDRFGILFWDPVQEWLHEAVLEDRLRLPIAAGLALLSYSSFDEIEESYLRPWSLGKAGWAGRYAAACTLWFMCLDEEQSPIALHTVDQWASYGSTEQRLSAIVAFTGELGVRYPSEASRRLWQLARQRNDLSVVAAAAFGDLFASLISREGGGRQVVTHLSKQVNELSPIGKTRLLYQRSLLAALCVVEALDPGTGKQAIVEYICDHPDEIPVVAQMWAALLKYRPSRHRTLTCLHSGLKTLGELSPDAADLAQKLGDALGAALPMKEQAALAVDFTKRTRKPAKSADRSVALAKILIRALERAQRLRKD
jgi:hypothetical protein